MNYNEPMVRLTIISISPGLGHLGLLFGLGYDVRNGVYILLPDLPVLWSVLVPKRHAKYVAGWSSDIERSRVIRDAVYFPKWVEFEKHSKTHILG